MLLTGRVAIFHPPRKRRNDTLALNFASPESLIAQ